MRKPDYRNITYAKTDADQLCSNCTADQRLCFHYSDSMVLFIFKSVMSSILPFPETVQVNLRRTWSETMKKGFLVSRLK